MKQEQELIPHTSTADFWRSLGHNVVPAINKKPIEDWHKWQDKQIPKSKHERWKNNNAFVDGLVVILGKSWINNMYLWAVDTHCRGIEPSIDEIHSIIDGDNGPPLKADDAFLVGNIERLTPMCLYGYCKQPFPKLKIKKTEVKNDIIYCPPSIAVWKVCLNGPAKPGEYNAEDLEWMGIFSNDYVIKYIQSEPFDMYTRISSHKNTYHRTSAKKNHYI